MKFDKYLPCEPLRPYIKQFVVSENDNAGEYKVFPSAGLVIGFQYKGRLKTIENNVGTPLASAGVTGVSDRFKLFGNSVNIGTVLVYFTEVGFTHFTAHPANELFNLSLSLDEVFDNGGIAEVEDGLCTAACDNERIQIVERFLLSQLKRRQIDKLVVEAVRLIYQSKGTIRVRELNGKLFISQSPFEKRFRKVVGTTPKKFASIIRFNTVLNSIDNNKSLTEICYENGFFDQSHFIKDFKQFTGETPENFKRFL